MDFLTTPWGFGSVFVAVAGLVVIVFGRGRMVIGRDGIKTGPDATRSEPALPEKYAREFMIMVERSGDHRDKVRDIRVKALEDQMRAFDEVFIAALAMFKLGFSDVIRPKALAVEVVRRERSAFVHMVKVAGHDLKDEVRKWFLANHYYALNTAERADYLETKKTTVKHLISDAFDNEWVSDAVPRDDLRAIGSDHQLEFDRLIESLFTRAFQISERALADENEEKAIYSAYMMNATGFNPYDREAC